jgi:hypothetical protein
MADIFIQRLFEQDRAQTGKMRRGDVPTTLPKQDQERYTAVDNWNAYSRSRDNGHNDWVKIARRCDAYYSGNQWDQETIDSLDQERRPHLTINQVLSTINSVKGEYIKAQQEISFQPRGKGATTEVARALSFVVKQVQYNNRSRWNETQVLEDGLIEDRGYFDLRLDFEDNVMGEIRETVRDPRDVLLDPGAKDYDPATWKEVIVTRWLTPDEIEAFYGREKAEPLRHRTFASRFGNDSVEFDLPTKTFGDETNPNGFVPDTHEDSLTVKRIRVIERQHKKLTRATFFVDPQEGDMRLAPDDWNDEQLAAHAARFDLDVLERPLLRIRWTVSADDILLEDDWSIYDSFTIVPFFPFFRRGQPTGMVRHLLSPQDMLNKISSQELHVINTTANSGWIFESGSLVNMDADDLETVGAKTGLILEFKKGSTPPEKILPNQVPTGLNNISAKAQVYFRSVSGIPETFMGQSSREVSGVTVEAQNQAATTQLEVVFDNLEKTRQYRADLMLELIQKFYTETRLVQVTELDIDGHEQTTEFNVNEIEVEVDPVTGEELPSAEETIINDLTLGEYSVVVTSVPHHETMADTIFSQVLQMREAGVAIPDWVLIENSRLPNRAEVSEVIKQLQGMAEPTPEEVEMQLMQQQLMLQGQQAQVRGMIADALLSEAQAAKAMAEAGAVEQELALRAQEIGINMRTQLESMDKDLQQKIAELETRLQISREKNATERSNVQIEQMGKRLQTALKTQVDLKKIAQPAPKNNSQ